MIKSTNFDNLKNMENKNSFFEKSEYSDFFRSGKTKQWKNELNQNQKNLKSKIKFFVITFLHDKTIFFDPDFFYVKVWTA